MSQSQSENYKKLIPLKKIAEASSYSFSYVSVLVQRKKLKAKKVGNKYYSTLEWFNQYLELHAQDGKKLSSGVAQKLPPDEISNKLRPAVDHPFLFKRKSEINNFIDSLVERLDRKKFKAYKAPARNDLAQVLNDKISLPEVEPVADFIEPETRLGIEWQKILNQEIKDLFKKQRIKKISTFSPWSLKGAFIISAVILDVVFLVIFFSGATAGFNQTVNRAVSGLRPSAAILSGFINYQGEAIGEIFYIAKNRFFAPSDFPNNKRNGLVAGAAEVNKPNFFPMTNFIALANTASHRGQEIINYAKNNSAAVLENTANCQKELSSNFSQKLAGLTLISAKKINSILQNSRNKLTQFKDTFSQALTQGE